MSERQSTDNQPTGVRHAVLRYILAAALVALATLLTKKMLPVIGEISPFFFVAVMLSAWFGGLGPGVLAAGLVACASVYYFFDFPPGTHGFGWDDAIRLGIFLMVSLLISFLLHMRKRAERQLRNANEHLEVRVAERTRELEASNRMTRESEQGFRALIEGVTDYAICLLDQEGRIVRWNSGAERIQGYREADVLQRHFEVFFPPHDRQLERPMEQLRFAARTGRHEGQGVRLRQDGTPFWANVIITSLQDESGALRGFAHVARDITELKRLEKEVLEISEDEQRRIGQDLHDGLGQELTGLAFLTKNVGRRLGQSNNPEAKELARISSLIDQAIEQTRDLARGLSPVEWESDGLAAALQNLSIRIRDTYGIPCEFHCGRRVLVESHVVAVNLYRIAQEALTNAARHSRATRIAIGLDCEGDETTVRIEDNGIGIVLTKPGVKGMGLHLMPYRARTIGAEFELEGRAGGGTIVRCRYRKTAELPYAQLPSRTGNGVIKQD